MSKTHTPTVPDDAAGQQQRTPNVLVVLVSGDDIDALRQCLAALSRQTHPRIGILAVDNASTDGSADLLGSSLGEDRVIRLPEDMGFPGAVSAALRSEHADRADYVLLMRDDTLLAPEAISALVEAAERMEGVGVVGPKVLDADDPTVLREIGMSIDLFGNPYSALEAGEIDQGQYDRIREVFYVSSSAMLVSVAAVTRAGPLDERLRSDLDEMDQCWRIRLAGFRILWTPTAVALSPGGRRDRTTTWAHTHTRYLRERAAVASMLKNYGFLSLAWILPLAIGQALVRAISYLFSRRFDDAWQVVAAWGWNLAHLFGTGRRRARAQAVRAVPDRHVRQFMASVWIRFDRWSRYTMETLRPAATAAATEADAEAERPTAWARARTLALTHPVAVAWVLTALVIAMSYRHLVTASPLAGGALAAFPSSPRGFFEEFVSGLRHTALGGTAPGTPALPMLGVSSAIAFANPSLAQKVLLLALPVLASIGCYRALQRIPVGRTAAVLGAACYGLSPIVLWGLSDGRLPELVFIAGLPWLTGRLIALFGSNPPARRVRWIAGAALGLAALGSFFPGAFLAAAVVAVIALILPGGGGRIAGLARVGLAVAGAALLAWPATVGILGSAGRSLADGVGTPSFGDALRVALAAAPGDWVIAFFLPIAAALGLGFASGAVRRPAARSMLMMLAGVYLAWAAANGWLPAWLSNPVSYAALAAFAMASLAAMGLESVLSGLHRRSFGMAQFGSALLVGVVTVGLAGQAFQAMRGSWEIGGSDRVSPAYAVVQPANGESYRVLWVGRRLGGSFPAPGGVPMGTAAAGSASVRFAVTAPPGASAYEFGRSLGGPGYGGLSEVLSAILSGPTRQGGAMLAPFGIRYVVAGNGDLPRRRPYASTSSSTWSARARPDSRSSATP